MKLVSFFLATYTLFTAAAIPMQLPQGSSSAANPGPNHIPKVEFGPWRVWKHDKAAAKDMIINHYNGLEPGNEHKGAKLAFVKTWWRDGKEPNDEHMQYLDFDYYKGERPIGDKIGQTVTVSRVRPPPETHFGKLIPKEHKLELAKEAEKEYKALPPDQAKFVRSMRVRNGWSDGPGLREQSQVTYHHAIAPKHDNTLWNPVTIYRPMSFLMDGNVPEREAPIIKKRIRQEHENLDENHPLKQANFGHVTEGWRPNARGTSRVVRATMYKVKDKLGFSDEEDFERVADFHVPLGNGRRPTASDRNLQASSSGATH